MSVESQTTNSSPIENLITEHIDIWSSAIKRKSSSGRGSSKKIELYGIKKLRELILELAVRGKLVAQDASDEPASALLERIAHEKAQLVKEGKIKKQKPLPDISEDEKPFELPEGWSYVRLQDIIHISSGKNLTSKVMNQNGSVPVFGGNGITGYHDKSNVSKRTLVIGRVGFYCGSIHITPRLAWVTDNAFITNFNSGCIYIDFLSWLLKSANLNENDSATAQPVISGRKIYPIIVALPPIDEQHRIVAKVDELMALCDQLEAQTESSLDANQTLVTVLLDTLVNSQNVEELAENWTRISGHFDTLFTTEHSIDQLKQTILQLAVMGKLVEQNPNDEPACVLLERIAAEKADLIKQGKIKKQKPLPDITGEEKPFDLPEGWDVTRLDDICFGVTSGSTPPKDKFDDKKGVPYLKVYNIKEQKIAFDYRPQFIDIEHHRKKLTRSILYPGDVVMNIVGPPLGKIAIIPDSFPEWNCNQAIVFFRPIEKILNNYIYTYLKSARFLDDIELIGTAGQDNISITKSRSIILPMPPLKEQHRIVAKVDELMAICDQLKAQLSEAQTTQLNLADALVEQAL
ncbi:restriction endonuclease subunit S [Marinomonas profundimaris]|uniref:Restriction endonuclease, S subunit n=1 Tax=Marinomonas profundimaris TaxID=1208321 RepID=W1RQ20_9GAMM|nr:restriction endonuclease subunit S [Marinomonas profundimaris]ETI58635.1 restriction endonuclease, S subunit [Marinomonas profundimaris]